MKRLFVAFLTVFVLVSTLCASALAFEIVLPDDDFGDEEVTYAAGDVNGDGKIDSTDLSVLIRAMSGASVEMAGNADLDDNGSIAAADCSALYRKLAGANV